MRFVDEGEQALGTGGAVRFAVDEARLDDAFFVLYGDSYLQIDLRAVARCFQQSDAEALMTVYRNEGAWTRATQPSTGTASSVPKGRARSCCHGDAPHRLRSADPAGGQRPGRVPQGPPSDLSDMLHSLSLEGLLAGYEAHHRFFEIGSPTGLADLQQHLASRP